MKSWTQWACKNLEKLNAQMLTVKFGKLKPRFTCPAKIAVSLY